MRARRPRVPLGRGGRGPSAATAPIAQHGGAAPPCRRTSAPSCAHRARHRVTVTHLGDLRVTVTINCNLAADMSADSDSAGDDSDSVAFSDNLLDDDDGDDEDEEHVPANEEEMDAFIAEMEEEDEEELGGGDLDDNVRQCRGITEDVLSLPTAAS